MNLLQLTRLDNTIIICFPLLLTAPLLTINQEAHTAQADGTAYNITQCNGDEIMHQTANGK